MALFLPVAAAGVYGSNNVHKHVLPLGLKNDSFDMDPQCPPLNTTGWDNHFCNSQPRTQADAFPQAWTHNGAAGGLSWGPPVAGGSCGDLATGDTSLHCAKSEERANEFRLSEAHGLGPLLEPWPSPVAEVATGEPRIPSLTLRISLVFLVSCVAILSSCSTAQPPWS